MKVFVILIVGFMNCCDSIHGKITIENFYDPCEPLSVCYFLNDSRNSLDREALELSNKSDSCNKTSFCMRVNMKPTAEDPCRHEFELAAVNIKNEMEYISIALSRDNQMAHDYAFYCTNGKSFVGLLDRRSGQKGVLTVSQRWKPSPIIQEDYNELKTVTNGNKFMRCGLTTKRVHHAKKEYFNLNIGVGPGPNKTMEHGWWLFMAHGIKRSIGTNDLRGEDKHKHAGYTSKALVLLEAPDSEKGKCDGNTIYGQETISLIYFVLLGTIANFVVFEIKDY